MRVVQIRSTLLLLAGCYTGSRGIGSARAQAPEGSVKVDLQPCILAKANIVRDTPGLSEVHLFNELFKGMWASSQHILIAPTGELDLTVDANHGKCNSIFVGINPSPPQYAQLAAYSQKFQVRIVYFDEAQTSDNVAIMAKLGMGQFFAPPLVDIPMIKLTAAATPRIVNPSLRTDPLANNIYVRPVRQVSVATGGTVEVVADYADSAGESLAVTEGAIVYPSVAALTYAGDGGKEEMHVFFSMAWFDLGSWAWGHYIAEWATKGIFSGERRFWLGATVDDLFLSTDQFEYNPTINNEGVLARMSDWDLSDAIIGTLTLNAKFNADIVTEYAFNAIGILEEAESSALLGFNDADEALLPKGQFPTNNGDGTVGLTTSILDPTWWSQSTVDSMNQEYTAGLWGADNLLRYVIRVLRYGFWQSHTLSHLARDNLGQYDCDAEDGGNTQIAVITKMFFSNNYNWRSMTNPGITGLFNSNCLSSAINNLITCGPGDNTYDGVQTTVSLVSNINQFHSLHTTEDANGLVGFQIVPRFATFVYYNCVTTECLVLENLFIRRRVCGCKNEDPGSMGNLNTDTSDCDMATKCPSGLEAFLSVDALFNTEASTTARLILSGRRDKYMFHQANVVSTSVPTGNMSLLLYWYEVVLGEMSNFLNLKGANPFPMKSVKFDDLCTNFKGHEDLDASGSLVTVTKTSTGSISGMTLSSTGAAGIIPITIPLTMLEEVSVTGLPTGQPYSQEAYGSDVTFYVATSEADQPQPVVVPSASDLAPVPP